MTVFRDLGEVEDQALLHLVGSSFHGAIVIKTELSNLPDRSRRTSSTITTAENELSQQAGSTYLPKNNLRLQKQEGENTDLIYGGDLGLVCGLITRREHIGKYLLIFSVLIIISCI